MICKYFSTGLYLLLLELILIVGTIIPSSWPHGRHRTIKPISNQWLNRRHLLRHQQETPNLFDPRYIKDDPVRLAFLDDRSNVIAAPIVQPSHPSNARHKSIPMFLGLAAIGGGAYIVVTRTSIWQKIAGSTAVRIITPKSAQGYKPLKRNSSKALNDPLLRTTSKQKSKFTNRAEVHLMLNALDISMPPDVTFHGPRVWPKHQSRREKSCCSVEQSVEPIASPGDFGKTVAREEMKHSQADPFEQIRSLAVKKKAIKKKNAGIKM